MNAGDVMTRELKTVSPTTGAEDAWFLMRQNRIHHLIVTHRSKLVGIVSDRDAGGRRGHAVRENRTVNDLMTGDVVTADAATPVRRVANLMRGRSIGCVVVTKASRPVGIITVSDLLELLGRAKERPPTNQQTGLNHRVPHRRQRLPSGVW